METKYVHTALAENFITKEDAEDIMDTLGCCDEDKKLQDFENWVFNELAGRIFASIKNKIEFRKETEADGVTYKAWLCWFDERKFLEDEASMPMNHTNKSFTKLEQAEAIITKVEQMRKWQKEYFRTRDGLALRKSKELEKEIDYMIISYRGGNINIIGNDPKQTTLEL